MQTTDIRPWGQFTVLHDGNDCKIKKIIVHPNKRLSLQSHEHRKELWLVIKGRGRAQLDDDILPIHVSSIIVVEQKQKHRLINDSEEDLEIIEIQTGSYFGEDDIIRYEDDFNRHIAQIGSSSI
jgi:mannose-6-phosphate isomerase-like protein (cupin superfamily)